MQRTWGREPLSSKARVSDFDEDTSLALDEEQSRAAFVSGNHSPPADQQPSGNHFRDEISATQRQRRQQSVRAAGLPNQLASNNSFEGQRQQGRRGEWNDLPGDDDSEYELQPQYTLSDPATHYDPFGSEFSGHDTSYKSQAAGASVGQLPSTKLSAVPRIQLSDPAEGDIGSGSESKVDPAPIPPPHVEGTATVARKDVPFQ
jgi:hypothetical protein